MFAMHPHGVFSLNHFITFSDATEFLTKVMPAPRRDLAASVIFLLPFFRDFVLWLGCVDAAATANKVLSNGYCMQLYPGGIAEQVETSSTEPKIVDTPATQRASRLCVQGRWLCAKWRKIAPC